MGEMKNALEIWHSSCKSQIKSEESFMKYWRSEYKKAKEEDKVAILIEIERYKASIQAYKNICQYLERVLADY